MPRRSHTRSGGRRRIPIPCPTMRKGTSNADVLTEFCGAQFSAFKAALVELAVAKLGPINTEMKRLMADPVYIDSVLADGAARARSFAAETMKAVKDIVGFV